MLLGDLIYPDGDVEEYERKFGRPYRPVLETEIDVRAVLGNHDLETDPSGMVRAFRMPGRFYTFRQGPVQFFALDTSTGILPAAQREWLSQRLAGSTAPWKIAFMHVPPYSAGWHGSSAALQTGLVELFDQYDVQLALGAHDHNYERTKSIRGTTYIVAGGGCCPRRAGRRSFTAMSVTGLSFVVIEVAGDVLRIEAISADGSMLDRATVERTTN